MKHFANYADVYPENVVQSIIGTTVTTSDGSAPDRLYAFNNVMLTDTPEKSDAGVSYKQEVRLVTNETLSLELRTKYSNHRPVVVILYDDQGNPMVFGDKTHKTRVFITPNLETYVLDFIRYSTEPLL